MENLDKDLVVLDENKVAIIDRIVSLEIKNTPDMEQAVAITQRIKEEKQKIDELKDLLVKPLKQQAKVIEAKLKPRIDELDKAESILKQKMVTYVSKQEQIRKEQEEKLRKEQEEKYLKELKKAEKKNVAPPPPPAPVVVEKQKVVGFSVREIWDFEIENENIIPREFMQPNLTKIRKCITAGLVIQGVKAFKKMSSAVSQKSNPMEDEI